MPIKLAHLQADIASIKETIQEKAYDQQLAETDSKLEIAQQDRLRLSTEATQLRKERDKVSADSLVATRLRVAQERLAELQAQVKNLRLGDVAWLRPIAACVELHYRNLP